MKKMIGMIFLLFVLLIPVGVDASSIQETSLTGGTIMSEEGAFSLSFQVQFSGIRNDRTDGVGVQIVSYELIFDDSVFRVASVTSDDWDSKILKEEGSYFIYSEVKGYTSSKNLCVNKTSYCGDYNVKINFVTKDMSQKSANIQVGEVLAILGRFNMDAPFHIGPQDSEPMIHTIITTSNQMQTIHFNQEETGTVNKPESSSNPLAPTPSEEQNQQSAEKNQNEPTYSTPEPSHNSYLKSLEIENYPIEFEKTKKLYRLTVDSNVNQLEIRAVPEYSKATYQILGADDLKANQSIVTIEVTAEDGSNNNYIIQVQQKTKLTQNEQKSKKFQIDSKYLKIGIIVLGVLILIAILIRYISNRKIDKALDKF